MALSEWISLEDILSFSFWPQQSTSQELDLLQEIWKINLFFFHRKRIKELNEITLIAQITKNDLKFVLFSNYIMLFYILFNIFTIKFT